MKLFFSFKGRIGRQQFWLTQLGMTVIFSLLFALVGAMMGPEKAAAGQTPSGPALAGLLVLIPLILMFLWASIALSVKRGHDRGRSGWWQFLALVPFANIWLAIDQGFFRGVDETNAWGPPAVPREALA
jgi:uncharacterized membrane protein YhaH (DUF805 family)